MGDIVQLLPNKLRSTYWGISLSIAMTTSLILGYVWLMGQARAEAHTEVHRVVTVELQRSMTDAATAAAVAAVQQSLLPIAEQMSANDREDKLVHAQLQAQLETLKLDRGVRIMSRKPSEH